MNIIEIKQIITNQLLEKGIQNAGIYILEKPFGYVAQIGYKDEKGRENYLNTILDTNGNTIYQLSPLNIYATGPIYKTETREVTDYKRTKSYISNKCNSTVRRTRRKPLSYTKINK